MDARRLTIDEVLELAAARYRRLEPAEALEASRRGAVLVDVRSEDERADQGVAIPEALRFPLSVVFWRLDPASPWRGVDLDLDTEVIVLCRHGYSSVLAAALLRELGFSRASDVVGGVEAWLEAGCPVEADCPVEPAGTGAPSQPAV